MEKGDIFFILVSYILEAKQELLPKDIKSNMSFKDIGLNRDEIIDAGKEMFAIDFQKRIEQTIVTIDDLVNVIYRYQNI